MSAIDRRSSAGAPPLGGIIHAAGVLDDGALVQLSPERIAAVLAPKVAGAWNLHAHSVERPLDWFVLFGSIASVVAVPGQAHYAAANAALDAVAQYRHALGLPAVSISWGPWAEVGMAARGAARRSIASRVPPLAPERALAALERVLAAKSGATHVVIAEGLESAIASAAARRPPAEMQINLLSRLARVPGGERRERIAQYLREEIATALGLPDAPAIDGDRPLQELGVDSLMAVEVSRALSAASGRRFAATLLFDYPTVNAISAHLSRELFPETAAAHTPAERGDTFVAEVATMSDEAAAALLEERLAAFDVDRLTR
jgi:myxalamid-type polyketide synthase MxaE and MxaD